MLARASCVRMSAPPRGLQCLPVSLSRAHRCTQVTRASNSSSSAPDDGQAASQKDELRQVIAEATPAPAEATQEDFSRFLKVVSSQSWEDVEAGVRSLAKQNALTEGVLTAGSAVLNSAIEREEDERIVESLRRVLGHMISEYERLNAPPDLVAIMEIAAAIGADDAAEAEALAMKALGGTDAQTAETSGTLREEPQGETPEELWQDALTKASAQLAAAAESSSGMVMLGKRGSFALSEKTAGDGAKCTEESLLDAMPSIFSLMEEQDAQFESSAGGDTSPEVEAFRAERVAIHRRVVTLRAHLVREKIKREEENEKGEKSEGAPPSPFEDQAVE
ncbi:hypothetical protein RI054_32g125930 [Pseudoscourfieldia marina]